MAPYISILGFSVQAYPLLLLMAAMAGLWLAARQAHRLGLDGDHIYNMGFYALLATLVGARLAFVISNWSAYRDAPLSALSLTPTGFAWLEGLVIGVLVALIYWLRYRLPAGPTLDALAPEKRRSIARETSEVYAPLAHRLGIWELKWQLEDLSFRYLESRKYHQIARLIAVRRDKREGLIAQAIQILSQEFDRAGLKAEVSGRPKHIYSIHQKMERSHPGSGI